MIDPKCTASFFSLYVVFLRGSMVASLDFDILARTSKKKTLFSGFKYRGSDPFFKPL